MKTIRQVKNKSLDILKDNEESMNIVNLILQKELKISKQELIAYDDRKVSIIKQLKIIRDLKKILKGIPLQYITNKQEFVYNEIYVNKNVLIPRNDTEILVEKCIDILKETADQKEKIDILDMCTGSGCILVAIAMYFKKENTVIYDKLRFIGSDISIKAIRVARKNMKRFNILEKVKLIKSDVYSNIDKQEFDLIISNPPYIETDLINKLDCNVKKEPHIALDGGKDGLFFYNLITSQLDKYLKKDGYIAFEIGYNQSESVSNILKKNGFNVQVIKDLSNNNRVVIGNRQV